MLKSADNQKYTKKYRNKASLLHQTSKKMTNFAVSYEVIAGCLASFFFAFALIFEFQLFF